MLVAHGMEHVEQHQQQQPMVTVGGAGAAVGVVDEKKSTVEGHIAYDQKMEHGYFCSICKYSPNTMRYLRDHIRWAFDKHLALNPITQIIC
jgi:hypothetical protein